MNPQKDTIRITNKDVHYSLMTFLFEEGEFLIQYIPSLGMSSYGNTVEEIKEMTLEQIKTFTKELARMTNKEKETTLIKLGWSKEALKHKNYSKASIDKEGVLKGLDLSDLKLKDIKEEPLELVA